MAKITAYFDASGSPDDTDVVAVGGLVSTAEKWIAFCGQWQECLDAFEVSALHMRDFSQSKREFSSWRNDEPRRSRFLSGLIRAIENHVEYTVASAVLMKHYRSLDERYCISEFMRPYTFAASTCVGAIARWARESAHHPAGIAYIFEKGDVDQSDVGRCWDSEFPEARLSPIFLRKGDYHPDPRVCAPIRPFEAADLIAYENLKGNLQIESSPGDVYQDQLRRLMKKPFGDRLPNGRGSVNTCKHAVAILSRAREKP